ncbi:hypothetical protein [Paenibacillus sp. PAMC21692]|uniref:hypothetical protein n=1 Tax=Paenibacillus sp. PAMC21692 TaxID=2762320 RepID=UPI00164ED251|nr:hypothetical protein [Paenibacillus sp. PAMC21692]QNK58112.1 hypothetical protein H7F31_03935 [Paenibacillus sp. PAMC21692]
MDQKHKEQLLKKSEYPDTWKDDIWGQLEARLDTEGGTRKSSSAGDNGEQADGGTVHRDSITGRSPSLGRANNRSNKTKHKGMRVMKIGVGVAAAVVALTVFLSLPAGTAMMESVKNWFEPEKKIEIDVEGQKEETNGQVHVDKTSDYAIYYDKDRYKLVEGEDKDVITTIDPLPEKYPEVSLTIEQKAEVLPEQLAKELAEQLQGEYDRVDAIERVTAPVDGYLVHAIDGSDWDSMVTNVYIVSNGKQGSFILSSKYFLEAAEGHGARFTQTLEQFQVLDGE